MRLVYGRAEMILLYVAIFLTSTYSSKAAATKDELGTTRIEDVPGGSSDVPDTLDLSFGLTSGKVTLNLTLNNHVTSKVPIFLGYNDSIEQYTNQTDNEFAVYTDLGNQASFLVHFLNQDGAQTRQYRGSFHVDGDEFVLEPQKTESSRRRRSADSAQMDYVFYKRNPNQDVFEDDSVERPEMSHMTEQMANYIGSSGYYPRGRQVYNVEMMLIVDYAIFNQWYRRSKSFYHENRVRDAVDNIRYYFSHIVNGIDMRYQNIKEVDFAIYVSLKALYIATTPSASPWTERYPNKEYGQNRDYTHAGRALDSLELWLNQTKHQLPPFDQATLYTGNILFNGLRSDGSRRKISGLADIQGVCTYYGASVNQDAGQYASIQTGAHELGHNLGAQHDNEVFNWCVSRDQYVMATSPGELTDNNARNAFTFSPCSRNYFRKFLFFLTTQGKNCLLDDNGNPDVRVRFGEGDLPGRRYNLTEQCRVKNGPHSYYCGGHENDGNMCRRVLCFVPELNRCADPVEQRAYDGTTCADRKWCNAGECVYHPQAPPAADFCLSGDFLGRFYDGRRCLELVREEPWQCYPDSPYQYHDQCCASCQALKDDNNKGCEYGDHAKYCANVKTRTPWQCYLPRVRRDCCATCAQIAAQRPAAKPGCEYGDRNSWCSRISKSGCYADSSRCCETCVRLRDNSYTDCPWGDKASWCRTIDRRACYRNRKTCCGTCKPWGPSGCEFGDKNSHCSQADCSDPVGREKCCHTCGTFSNTPTVCTDEVSWCSTINRGDCTTESIKRLCCRKCALEKVGPPGCEYGDKYSWCRKIYCDREKTNCCATCQ